MGGALTGVYAEELTRQAIFEALRRHRTVATDGSRISVQFWADDAFIGDELVTDHAPTVRWQVDGTTAAVTVSLVYDGEIVQVWSAPPGRADGAYTHSTCALGQHWYYLAVEQSTLWRHWPSNVAIARGPRAWTSPIWVRRT